MKNLNDYIEQWFGGQNAKLAMLPVWQEILVRSNDFNKQFHFWQQSDLHRPMLVQLSNLYNKYLLEVKTTEIRFIDKDLSGGFMWYIQKADFSENDFTFLTDYLKQKLQTLNYKTTLSDVRFYDRKTFSETVERHYLKPRLVIDENNKAVQLYGNIHIELYKRNDELIQLKFLVTAYQDHNYLPALPFTDLMQHLIKFNDEV